MKPEEKPSRAHVLHNAWLGTLVMIRQLPTGEWIGLHRFMFTIGLLVGVDETSYRTRFCYRSVRDAMQAALGWDGTGDPPGDWIMEKGRNVDRQNPNLKGIPVVTELRR